MQHQNIAYTFVDIWCMTTMPEKDSQYHLQDIPMIMPDNILVGIINIYSIQIAAQQQSVQECPGAVSPALSPPIIAQSAGSGSIRNRALNSDALPEQKHSSNLFSSQKLNARLVKVLKIAIEHGHLCLLAKHACVRGWPGFSSRSCPDIPPLQKTVEPLHLKDQAEVWQCMGVCRINQCAILVQMQTSRV